MFIIISLNVKFNYNSNTVFPSKLKDNVSSHLILLLALLTILLAVSYLELKLSIHISNDIIGNDYLLFKEFTHIELSLWSIFNLLQELKPQIYLAYHFLTAVFVG